MDEILKDIAEFVEGCLGPLSNNGDISTWLRDFLIQLIATLLLFLVVKIFLWKPLTEFLEARRDKIDKDLTLAEESRVKAIKIETELALKYDAAKVEIQKLLKEAELAGNLRKEEIIKEAKEEAALRLSMAKEEINREILEQENNIKNQIVEIAFLAAETIVGEEVDRKQYLDAVTKIIESGMNNG